MCQGSSVIRKAITGAVRFFVISERLELARKTYYEEILPEVYKAPEILLQTKCGDGTGQGAS